MKAIINTENGVYKIILLNEFNNYKDIFVVDELYLEKYKVNCNDFAGWVKTEANREVKP